MEFYEKKDEKVITGTQEKNIKSAKEEVKVIEEKKDNEHRKTEIKYEVKNKKNAKNKIIIISVVSAIILIAILLCCTIFALLNVNNTKIVKGVTINKINVQELTKEEAKEVIKQKIEYELNKDIIIKTEDFEYSIKLSQIELEYKLEQSIENAYNIGRNGNIFVNNFDILNSMIRGKDINLEYTYNEELIGSIIKEISLKIPGAVEQANYYIENEKLYISKGKMGNTINQEKLKEDILNKINSENKEDIILEIYQTEPSQIDIEKIHNEIYKEPKDAYYIKEPFEVFPHVDGMDFDLEKAKEILKEDKEEYEIPLIITRPKITTDQMGTEAFPDLISTFSTNYDANNIPRTTNLKLAMQKLNGYVVNPGEVFSYNQALGKRTAEAGYKQAGGYAGGRVVQTLAGGICQISSTLYDAVVYANLDIVERHNHMFLAGYVGAGKDATVVYGSLDFKFKNTRNYPIMIKTSIGGGTAKISIYGVKEETEYDVEISTTVLSTIPYRVIYEEDSTLEPGKEKVVQGGMNGCKSITYKILRLNGQEISRTVLSSDTYDPMNKIIKRGSINTVETNTNLENNTPKEEQPIIEPEQPVVPEQPIQPEQPEIPKEEPVVPEETLPGIPEESPEIPQENLEEEI